VCVLFHSDECNRCVSLSRDMPRLLLTVRDEQSGIKSITCTVYDATLKIDVWTTTQGPQRLPLAHIDTDDLVPEDPEDDENPEGSVREERV